MFGLVLILNYVWGYLPNKVRFVLNWVINIYFGFLIFNFVLIGVDGIRVLTTSVFSAIIQFVANIYYVIIDPFLSVVLGIYTIILDAFFTAFGINT
jgi:hypothetical protein